MNKATIAKEIKFFQRIIVYAILSGIGIAIVCLLIFKPWKFDSKKYRELKGKGLSYSNRNSTQGSAFPSVSSHPYWLVDGFHKFCDGKVGFNPKFPQVSYQLRKDYLINKSIRLGIYSALTMLAGVALFRYGKRGQKWVNDNSN